MNAFCRLLCLGIVALTAPELRAQDRPVAPVRPIEDIYHGTKIVDPYRWMEEPDNLELMTWMRAQNAHTRDFLASIPGRAGLLDRIEELGQTFAEVWSVRRAGERLFYLKRDPGAELGKLYTRERLDASERLLVDPEKLQSNGGHLSLTVFYPSLDGRHVAYVLAEGGSDEGTLHVLETETGRVLEERIDRVDFPEVQWRPDGRSFFYTRFPQPRPEDLPADRFKRAPVYLHALGSNADGDRDVAIFGYGVSPRISVEPDEGSVLVLRPGSRYVFGLVHRFVKPEFRLYVAPLDSLDGARTPWRGVAGYEDEVTAFDVRSNDLYLLSHKDAPRFKILRTNVTAPALASAELVMPEGGVVIKGLAVAMDALYVQGMEGGVGRLWRLKFGEGSVATPIALPMQGTLLPLWLEAFTAKMPVTDPQVPGALIQMTSWLEPERWFVYDPSVDRVDDAGLLPATDFDTSAFEAVEVELRGYDGQMIPLSIVHRRGIARDGSHSTLLWGYGSYGVELTPYFLPFAIAWMEEGGIFAVAHVRGGGWHGEEWHKAGMQGTKMNTVRDFVSSAEHLISQRYTRPERLVSMGASAGGITVGRALELRPDLFGAVIDMVGVSDMVRAELTPNGPPNIAEFGSVASREGFEALHAMSPYHHIEDDIDYPAVLLTTGINDSRVESWMPAKMAARLQAASSSGKPVLLRVDFDSGHGSGATRSQENEEMADALAFALWQVGVPKFQPVAATISSGGASTPNR